MCGSTELRNEMIQAIIFTLAYSILSMIISLPFDIFSTFVIEEKWGFNKTTGKIFFCDQMKGLLITAVLSAILIPLLLWIIDISGSALVPNLISFTVIILLFF